MQKLVFTETKGVSRIIKTHELPILPPLRQSIDATQTGHPVYLVTAFGKPHSVKAFGNWFKKRCREAGLGEVSAHGLRKLGAQRCAEAGASEHQLMALFGWSNPQQAAVYTKKANRAKLEAQAAVLLHAQTSNKLSHFLRRWRPVGQTGQKAVIISGVFEGWRPQGDSNPCSRRERAVSPNSGRRPRVHRQCPRCTPHRLFCPTAQSRRVALKNFNWWYSILVKYVERRRRAG